MKNHIIIEDTKNCCGCGACINICPRDAIGMKECELGFSYPDVDETKCIDCGLCRKVCVFTDKGTGANGEPLVYAAASKSNAVLLSSSSGGIFTELAEAVIDKGGAVFGAAWDESLSLHHICVDNKSDLAMLRGSKYVQSATENAYRAAKELLDGGRYVCYSGTPCQIAGLKAYLKKDYDKLLTLDIICHGVPSMKMLKDDLSYVAGKKNINVKDIKFRDKSYGWGVLGSLTGDSSKIKYHSGTSPYYFYFLNGEIYRDSCYNCRFPAEGRQGDITLGDYWGIRQELAAEMGDVDIDKGVSCILVNNDKGKRWMSQIKDKLLIAGSDRKSAEKRNKQLTHASVPTPEHNALSDMYKKKGYEAFLYWYKKHYKEHVIGAVKRIIPAKIKRQLMQAYSRLKG
ncbi:MAG: Coenzyme F420 hydrogenase/dehydrogenase, beta subunit C-terminal domain [Clostridia bacterium]|nr:Coenzyme F420 hydrogenase/dehydrogenase, beta subunit C-terminal domain [Clostridia bacterium]